MKMSFEIVEEIKRNSEKVKDLDNIVKSAKWSERNAENIAEAAKAAELLRIENKILKDNARRAMFAEVLPVILDELSKYAGKPYGEKTKEKINNAVKARANCAFYISGGDFNIIPLNEKGFSGCGVWGYDDFRVYTKYETNGERPHVLEDNKIVVLPLSAFALWNCGEYVEDTKERAALILSEFDALKEARAEFERKCSAFNSLVPSGISHASPREWRNFLM